MVRGWREAVNVLLGVEDHSGGPSGLRHPFLHFPPPKPTEGHCFLPTCFSPRAEGLLDHRITSLQDYITPGGAVLSRLWVDSISWRCPVHNLHSLMLASLVRKGLGASVGASVRALVRAIVRTLIRASLRASLVRDSIWASVGENLRALVRDRLLVKDSIRGLVRDRIREIVRGI